MYPARIHRNQLATLSCARRHFHDRCTTSSYLRYEIDGKSQIKNCYLLKTEFFNRIGQNLSPATSTLPLTFAARTAGDCLENRERFKGSYHMPPFLMYAAEFVTQIKTGSSRVEGEYCVSRIMSKNSGLPAKLQRVTTSL